MEYLIFDIILVSFCLLALFIMGIIIGICLDKCTNIHKRKKSKTRANFINIEDLD